MGPPAAQPEKCKLGCNVVWRLLLLGPLLLATQTRACTSNRSGRRLPTAVERGRVVPAPCISVTDSTDILSTRARDPPPLDAGTGAAVGSPVSRRVCDILATLVAADSNPPGFEGRICVGAVEENVPHWWLVTFAAGRAESRQRVGAPFDPDQADVLLVLGPGSAQHLPEGTRPDARDLWVSGDRRLLIRFTDRYLKRRSWLDLRREETPSRRKG